jgi:hypothetical protein
MQKGYTAAVHEQGWDLLLPLMGYKPKKSVVVVADEAQLAQQAAVAELDQADGPLFLTTEATLEDRFPDQYQYIFEDLSAATGVAAVGTMTTYVDRVVALRDGEDPTREATREQDQAAVALLAERDIFTPDKEKHFRTLLALATGFVPPAVIEETLTEAEFWETARQFHIWLREWRKMADAVITRKDYQITLGLAKRKTRKKKKEGEGEGE